jgi:hypothetical protein
MRNLRLALERDGGFAAVPGLSRPLTLEASALAPALRDALHGLVAAALAEHAARGVKPARPPPAGATPDGRTYRLHIQHAEGARSLEACDPSVPPAFAALMAFTEKHGVRQA